MLTKARGETLDLCAVCVAGLDAFLRNEPADPYAPPESAFEAIAPRAFNDD